MGKISVHERTVKSKVMVGDRVAVVENISYPFFEGDDEKNKKMCSKMNAFYTSVAQKLSFYATKRLPKRLKKSIAKQQRPVLVSMVYRVSLCDERLISVVLDLSFSGAKVEKTRRFSQIWSVKNGDILPMSEVVASDRKSRKRLLEIAVGVARENGKRKDFGYFDDYLTRLCKSLDTRNCFVVPNGMCFFVNAGILSPVKYGTSNFVVPIDKAKPFLRENFVSQTLEKSEQYGEIVNKI